MNLYYDNELNERIYKRNIPSKNLKPNFDYRPTSTKYEIKEKEPQEKLHSYKLETKFNPGYRGETDYFFYNIDKESELRNQFMALQKDVQSHYIPKENSDLYNNKMDYKKIYTKYQSQLPNKNYENLAPFNFNNHTRYNIKNL
jgi:hypothetical protein